MLTAAGGRSGSAGLSANGELTGTIASASDARGLCASPTLTGVRLADLPFPAVVTGPHGRHWEMARLHLEGDELIVFGYGEGRVRVEDELTVADYTPPTRAARGETPTAVITDTNGGQWFVSKGRGCGCGHPLKRANLKAILARP